MKTWGQKRVTQNSSTSISFYNIHMIYIVYIFMCGCPKPKWVQHAISQTTIFFFEVQILTRRLTNDALSSSDRPLRFLRTRATCGGQHGQVDSGKSFQLNHGLVGPLHFCKVIRHEFIYNYIICKYLLHQFRWSFSELFFFDISMVFSWKYLTRSLSCPNSNL